MDSTLHYSLWALTARRNADFEVARAGASSPKLPFLRTAGAPREPYERARGRSYGTCRAPAQRGLVVWWFGGVVHVVHVVQVVHVVKLGAYIVKLPVMLLHPKPYRFIRVRFA